MLEHVKKTAFLADADAEALTPTPKQLGNARFYDFKIFLKYVLIYMFLKQEKSKMTILWKKNFGSKGKVLNKNSNF